MENQDRPTQFKLPRVMITYCTKCKWLLRAAYYGQELLSTFETAIGEVALVPTTGGIFTVHLEYDAGTADGQKNNGRKEILIWDRKAEKGFPETKILKQKIRDIIQPDRNLGHSDTPSARPTVHPDEGEATQSTSAPDGTVTTTASTQKNGAV